MKKPMEKVNIDMNKKDHTRKMWLIVLGGLGLLAFIMMFSITKGTENIPLASLWDALFHFNEKEMNHLVIFNLRIPRVVASALVGAALAVSGAIMQGTTGNPLADSGLLGLNAGAAFALSICFAFFPGMKYIHIILFSFLGAALGAILVNGIASMKRGGQTPIRLVLAGAAVSTLLVAMSQGIALYFNVAQSIMFWTVGGVAGSNWEQVRIMLPWIMGGLIGSIVLSPYISILSLGQDVAKGLGINIKLVNLLSSLTVLILVGASVSVVGSVGFVGLIVPHIARFFVGMDYKLIIPSTAVMGALLVVLADLGARTLNPPFETPIGAIISLIGVPLFLSLARRQRSAM
ncbi:iron ABC transporter permease [Clostridium sporogenes]|uniref:Iron ABC transporter permease n=1 Tax=Clostridium botulinum TaxID=1491 RepID=A0A6M0STQ0_CLOBO|nr:iron ABC transporter permease [Clostridium sporogenes]NFA58879.1 iron ABC transporter permease [Clostridium botulinum]NFI73462.1 iron ABC transporter permease [Clostridium sporogenes]NFL71514.1 iron ABC transporter permease [Clostridium sporogenes]NFM23321.1 iron ABC transporter permease [Clostridium sporogenes]NFP61290.1 iron ABC transporter permease [Clostridium sporogenes]